MKYTCPHCGKKTFSPLQKALCGGMTAYGKPCPECGKRCVNGKAAMVANSILALLGLAAIIYAWFSFKTMQDVLLRGVIPFAVTILLRFLSNMFIGNLIPAMRRE